MRTISFNLLDPERSELHENIKAMFALCSSLKKIPDISKWNINKDINKNSNLLSEICSSFELNSDILTKKEFFYNVFLI